MTKSSVNKNITNHLYWRGSLVPSKHLSAHAFNMDYEDMPDGAYYAMSEEQGISMEAHQSYAKWQSTISPE